jgi:hypothetical protein
MAGLDGNSRDVKSWRAKDSAPAFVVTIMSASRAAVAPATGRSQRGRRPSFNLIAVVPIAWTSLIFAAQASVAAWVVRWALTVARVFVVVSVALRAWAVARV